MTDKTNAEIEELRDLGPEGIPDDQLDDDADLGQQVRRITSLRLEDLESTVKTGTWRPFVITLQLGDDEIVEFQFEMLIGSYYSPDVQSYYARLQEAEIKGSKKLQQLRNRARQRRDFDFQLPPEVSQRINRRVMVDKVVMNWRGWEEVPYSRENCEALLEKVPHLISDIIDVSGGQANYLRVREHDAVSD